MSDSNIPVHVAVIPDGNRRWAKEKGLIATAGHLKAGSKEHLNALFQEAKRLGVKYVSLWGFSTENWKRDDDEKSKLFEVFTRGADILIEMAERERFRFKHIGRKDRLPEELRKKFEQLEEDTVDNEEMYVILCIDYGGRDEILRAIGKILKDGKREVNENSFASYLDTGGIPDPDLIIRTGGEMRMSGFMPFQSVYSELYFTDTYFPDFGPAELREAIEDYGKRKRRFGGN